MNAQEAASQTRARIQRIISRMIRKSKNNDMISGSLLKQNIAQMDTRQNRRKGGLGRK